jgi:NAD(P)-dependent dehydrogenase (short-subunit alcohol dehydrogenase family)
MTDKKVWLITGAGRGMGVDIAKAALDAGPNVVVSHVCQHVLRLPGSRATG